MLEKPLCSWYPNINHMVRIGPPICICGDIHSLNSLKERSFHGPGHPRLTQVSLKEPQQHTEEQRWLVLHFRGETTHVTHPFCTFYCEAEKCTEVWRGKMVPWSLLQWQMCKITILLSWEVQDVMAYVTLLWKSSFCTCLIHSARCSLQHTSYRVCTASWTFCLVNLHHLTHGRCYQTLKGHSELHSSRTGGGAIKVSVTHSSNKRQQHQSTGCRLVCVCYGTAKRGLGRVYQLSLYFSREALTVRGATHLMAYR